jgi:hypothetical protein
MVLLKISNTDRFAFWEGGPNHPTQQEIDRFRYVITDWLDDVVESSSREGLFIGYELATKSAESESVPSQ